MYQSDLTEKQWQQIEHYFKRSDPRGAVGKHSKLRVVNAIFYVLEGGIKWRMLPKDFPPWQTVYDHFRRWVERGVWQQVLYDLNQISRRRENRHPNPSYALIDAQSVKTQYKGSEIGYDSGKKNKGKKAAHSD